MEHKLNSKELKVSAEEKSNEEKNKKEKPKEEKPKKKLKLGKKLTICGLIIACMTLISTVIFNVLPISIKIIKSEEDLSYSESLYQSGMEFFRQAEYGKAIDYYNKAIDDHKERQYAGRETACFYRSLGIVYELTGKIKDAIDCYGNGVGILSWLISKYTEERSSEKDRLEYELGYIYYLRGMAYLEKDDYDRAFKDYEQCCSAVELIDQYDDWESLYTVASACNLGGGICMGVAYEKISGFPSDQDTDNNTMNYSFTLENAFEQFNLALSFKGVEVIPYTQIDNNKDIVVTGYDVSGEENYDANNADTDDRIIYIRKKRLPLPWKIINKDAETARILTNRATVENIMELYDEAIEDCEAALAVYESVPYNEWYDVSTTYTQLAIAKLHKSFEENGETPDEAVVQECYDWLKKALPYCTKWRGVYTPQTAYLYEMMGGIIMLKNEYDEAIKCFSAAEEIFVELGMEEDVEVERKWIEIAKECEESYNEDNLEWRIQYYNLE